jgi:hypothetical protein
MPIRHVDIPLIGDKEERIKRLLLGKKKKKG